METLVIRVFHSPPKLTDVIIGTISLHTETGDPRLQVSKARKWARKYIKQHYPSAQIEIHHFEKS